MSVHRADFYVVLANSTDGYPPFPLGILVVPQGVPASLAGILDDTDGVDIVPFAHVQLHVALQAAIRNVWNTITEEATPEP